MKYHALEKADVEKGKRKKEEKMLRLSELTQARESERAKHYHNIDLTDHHYSTTIRNNAVQVRWPGRVTARFQIAPLPNCAASKLLRFQIAPLPNWAKLWRGSNCAASLNCDVVVPSIIVHGKVRSWI